MRVSPFLFDNLSGRVMSRYAKILSVVCLLIGIGLVGVVSTTAQFDTCVGGASIEEIEYGDEVFGSISFGVSKMGEGLYCFEGKRGDPIAIDVEVTRGEEAIKVSLLNIGSLSFEPIAQSMSLDGAVRLRFTLPADSAYHISISRSLGFDATSYTLSLENLNDVERATATSGPSATPRPSPTAVPTLTDAQAATPCTPGAYILIPGHAAEFFINIQSITQTYCLAGRAGTRYRVTVETIQGTLDPMVLVYSSEFETLLTSNNNAEEGETTARAEFRASDTAIYPIVIVRAGFNTGITEGIYRVIVENLTTDEAEGCPRAFQIPDTGLSIEAAQQDGLHAFCVDGGEGQEITLNAEAKSGTLAMTVYIIEPNWDTVADLSTTSETLEITAALEKDQPYFILVFDDTGQGGFDLSLTKN